MKDEKLKLKNHKQSRDKSGSRIWFSAYVKPSGRYWKRKASKAARKSDDLSCGGAYKKCFGWMEWC